MLSFDDKFEVQDFSRSQQTFPNVPGVPDQLAHDGKTRLFAKMNVGDKSVIALTHRKYRSIEFRKYRKKNDREVKDPSHVYIAYDDYGTHKHPTMKTRVAKDSLFHIYYSPTYSS